MLDDNNVLDQFYVRDHLNEYMASVEQMANYPLLSWLSSQAKITKLICGWRWCLWPWYDKIWLDGTELL